MTGTPNTYHPFPSPAHPPRTCLPRRHDLPNVHDAAIELAELAVTTVMAASEAAAPPEKVQRALLAAQVAHEEAAVAAEAVCHSWNLLKQAYVRERAKRARERLEAARRKADSAAVASAAAAAATAVVGGPLVFATLGRNESAALLVQRQVSRFCARGAQVLESSRGGDSARDSAIYRTLSTYHLRCVRIESAVTAI